MSLFVVLGATASAAQVAPPDSRLDRVEAWLKAILHHDPGIDDASLRLVGAWTNSQVQQLWLDVNVLIQMTRSPGGLSFSVQQAGQRRATPVRYTVDQFQRMRLLACAAAGTLAEPTCARFRRSPGAPPGAPAGADLDPDLVRLAVAVQASRLKGDDNFVLRRGALLHTDIAMLGLEAPETSASYPTAGPQRIRMDTTDGQSTGIVLSADHWQVARTLLDFVRPGTSGRAAPGQDEMVRLWYRATSAWMQGQERHDRMHLDKARLVFPGDPDILFLSACQHEVFAGPPIQSAVRGAALPTGFSLDIVGEHAELREAEALFRRTLAARPEFPEAHLRYGRVLGRLGRHADAAAQLRQAVDSLQDEALLYYAELFLGAEEEALSRFESARGWYERAAIRQPTSQSPRLALSQLARRRGDRAAALDALAEVWKLQDGEAREDPWWRYQVSQARDVNELLTNLRRMVRSPE